jgi:hypothetical protein
MIEAGVVLDKFGFPIWWHGPEGRSSVNLPDSRELWDVLWKMRGAISGFAHSHPGGGIPFPSSEDLTTFAAVEAGLGLRLDWWIINATDVTLCHWAPGEQRYRHTYIPTDAFSWVARLRELSNMGG